MLYRFVLPPQSTTVEMNWLRNGHVLSMHRVVSRHPRHIHHPSRIRLACGLLLPALQVTTFVLSPWAIKPSEGDYWRIQMCGSDVEGFRHNMQLGMKGWHDPIELKPSNLWWAKEEKP